MAGIQPSGKGELIRKQHAKVMKELDSNSDGTVDVKEATAYFSRLQSMHEEAHNRYPPEHHDLFYKFKVAPQLRQIQLRELWPGRGYSGLS